MEFTGNMHTPPPEPPPSFLDRDGFHILCEIEPPRRPDIEHVRDQIEVLRPVVDGFLIPDNHLGRATVSSVAVAHEVSYMGGLSIACINARDRNVLGFRRDLLTAAAYGVNHFLFVYGDPPKEGRRTEDLTVRGMMQQVHDFGNGPLFSGFPDFRIGTVAKPGKPLSWRTHAEFVFMQISFATERLIRWREETDFDGKVYAGVLVLTNKRMAQRVNAALPDVRIPQSIIDKLDDDPQIGIDIAMDQIETLRASGAFDGIHLIPVSKFREISQRLSGGGGR
jgi:5,10-methylenetetrahydrofolate reductase